MPRLLISASGEEDQVRIRVTRDEGEAAPGFFAEGLVKDDARGLELEVRPTAGSADTEIGCFRRREARDAEAEIQWRVQDRGSPPGG